MDQFEREWGHLFESQSAPQPEPIRPTTNMALAAVRGQQPGNLTTARRMAQELGIAPEMALDLPQESLEELRARQIAANPGLADWASRSTQNAAHARDNASFLSSFADAFTSFGADALHNITFHGPEIAANAGRSLVAGAADFNYALANTARAAAENLFGPDSLAARYLQSASQWADSSRKRYAPKADSTAGQFGYDFLRVAPQMAGTVMASLTNPVAATSLMGSQILGSSYGQMRDKGVSPARALASAATNTAIALPMERLGFDKLIAAIRTTGASAAVRQWLGAAVTEGTTEALQKAPDYVTQLWAEAELHGNTFDDRAQWFAGQLTDADNLMRATEEALYEGLIGAAWGGAFGSVGAVRSLRAGFPQEGGQADMPEELERLMADTSQESRAMAERQALGNALYQAAHSLDGAPASNDPDALQQMADASLPEAFRQTWIGPDDALALYQQAIQADPAQADALLYSLDQTPESLMQAVEQGAPLPVQTAAVLAQLSGDQRDQTLDALRPTPDGASGTEAAQWDPALRIGAAMRAGMDDIENVPPSVDEAKSAQKTRADVNREITRITHEIEATGLYTRQAAETYALLAQQRALSAQAAYGVDPVAMLRRINIARGQDGEDGGLFQFLGQQGASNLDMAEESTIRMDNLAIARQMEEAGREPAAIKMATGWERGADSKWRYEIPEGRIRDEIRQKGFLPSRAEIETAKQEAEILYQARNAAKHPELTEDEFIEQFGGPREFWDEEDFGPYEDMQEQMRESWRFARGKTLEEVETLYNEAQERTNRLALQKDASYSLGEFYDNPALFAAYPDLQQMNISVSQQQMYGPKGLRDDTGISLFPPNMALPNYEYLESILAHELQHAIQKIEGFARGGTPDGIGFDTYQALAGEVEARNTQARMNMSARERLASLASATEDVAREDQIFIYHGQNTAASMEADPYSAKGPRNSDGIPLSRVTAFDRPFSREEVERALSALAGKDLHNSIEGISAQVNATQRRKLKSKKAIDKSIDNGFTGGVHLSLAAKIESLWNWAARVTPDSNAPIQRFVSAVRIGDEDAYAWLTVKNSEEGLRIYSLELLDKQKLEKTFSTSATENPKSTTNSSFNEIIERLNKPVKHQADANPLFQLAWHGTPYKFDQFSVKYIDKGEGMQAHGWGLYFAQGRETAEGYRAKLLEESTPVLLVNGQRYTAKEVDGGLAWRDERGVFLPDYENQHLTYLQQKAESGNTDQEYLEFLQTWVADESLTQEQRDILTRQMDEYQNADVKLEQPGQVFQVDIPDSDVLLDEQKTYAEQPEKVKEALEKAILALDDTGAERPYAREIFDKVFIDESATGKEIYNAFMVATGSDESASKYLNRYGIKGITYMGGIDGRCFVVFDDQAIQILDTFYQQEAQARPLGMVTLSADNAAVRVFGRPGSGQSANLSTIPHEFGHVFLDDLQRISEDDGSIALNNLRGQLGLLLHGAQPDLRDNINAMLDSAQDIPTLRTVAATLRQQAQDARETVRINEQVVRELQQKAQEEGKQYQPGEERPWKDSLTEARLSQVDASNYSRAERLVRNAIRHLQGLEQARADIRTLRQWAQVPEDGPLARGSEDYVKLHEAVARGFEQYLREGKAPSRKLEAVFGRMRDWLMKIYQHARDVLGLPITDDVRLVFDRMLATDKEIRQNKGMRRILDAENDFMGSGQLYHDEWEELNALRSEAEREVQAAMDRATLRDRNKRYKAYYLEAMDALGGSPFWQMVENLSARRRDQITGQSRGGINKSSLLHYLGKDQTADLARKRPGIVNAGDLGLDLDIIGLEEGYDDADALAHELYDAIVVRDESRQKLAKAHAEQRLADEDRMYEDEAMAWGSEAYAAYLDKVDEVALRMAARKGYKTQEEQDRFVRNAITPRQRIKDQAAMELAHTALRDISTARYQAMLDKALRDRSQALVDGNLMAVINAVDKARLANELIWQSRERLRTADATLKLAGETGSAKAGTFPTVHAAALSKLLNQYSLAHMRAATDPVLAHSSLRELVQQTLPPDDAGEGILPSFPDWLLNSQDPKTMQALPQGRQSWRDLTPSQLQEVENLLKYLRKTGYDARRDNKEAEAARIQTMVDKAVAAMQPLPDIQQAPADTLRRKAQDAMRSLYAATDSLRWQMRKADGFTNVQGEGTKGVMEEAVLDKAIEGEQRCRQRIDDISEAMAPHLAHLAKTVRGWEEQYGKNLMLRDSQGNLVETPPSFDDAYKRKTWTPDMVLSLALNCGNTSNMARIVSGYPDLSYDTLAELLGDHVATRIANAARGLEGQPPISQRGQRPGLLTAADWQAIQGIWNALATQWADTQAVHERMFGFKPQGVQAMPMSFADARGTVVHLDGGYYPVRYDPNISQRVANWSEQEDILSRNESQFAVPAAKRGHTQARAERAPGLPLRLDTSIIMEHINDTVRLIELGELVRQADRVTQAPAFREAYIRAYGKADYDAIRPNLRALVRQEPPPRGDWIVSAANVMRKYLVPWGLAWNLKVAALQLTALFPAMGDVGAGPVLRGMAHMARHPLAMRQIWDASPYMRSRLDNIDQDLQRNMAKFDAGKRPRSITIGKREYTWDDLVNAGMMPIVCMDAVATSAIWMGAYNKQLAALQGKSTNYGIDTDSKHHAEAVAFADSIIKQSNPDYDPSSRSGFLRAQNAYRLVNGFASAVTLFASRHKYMYTARAKGKISRARLARFEMFDTLVPAAAMFLMLALARGYMGDDADDSEEKLMKLGMATLADSVSMRLPIFGSAIGDGVLALMNMNEGGYKAGGLRTTLDEPVRQFAGMTNRVGKAIWEGVENEEQARALVYGAADVASFISRIPVSKVVRNAERGLEQWERGEGTAFSILMPRPGK